MIRIVAVFRLDHGSWRNQITSNSQLQHATSRDIVPTGYTNVEVRSIILYVVRKQSILNAKCQKFYAPMVCGMRYAGLVAYDER